MRGAVLAPPPTTAVSHPSTGGSDNIRLFPTSAVVPHGTTFTMRGDLMSDLMETFFRLLARHYRRYGLVAAPQLCVVYFICAHLRDASLGTMLSGNMDRS